MADSIVLMKKKTCETCKRKPGILSLCKYCNMYYCFNCLQVEIHNCKDIATLKEHKRATLRNQLENAKCIGAKINYI